MGVGVGGAGEWSQGLKLKVDILEWQQLSLQCAAAVLGTHGAHGAPKVLSLTKMMISKTKTGFGYHKHDFLNKQRFSKRNHDV